MLHGLRRASAALIAAIGLLVVSALPAWAAQSITVTWVRHAESTANAEGIISSTVPGPGLTALGEQQALAIAQILDANVHDGIYVSDMVRTALTAAPYAALSGITPDVVGGVREITAGYLEGLPGTGAESLAYTAAGLLYVLPVAAWSLGVRSLPVVFGETGNNFDARVNDALAAIYASGDVNPVVFSHGATIQAWTLMNVTNPVIKAPLENTGVVVVTGNPEDGWTLQSWEGEEVSPTPDLLTKLFLDFRELIVTPQRSLYTILQSLPYDSWFADGSSLATVAAAVWDGIVAIVTAPITFVTSVIRDIGQAIVPSRATAPSPAGTQTRETPGEVAAGSVAPGAAPVDGAAAPGPLSVGDPGGKVLRRDRALRPARATAPSGAAARAASRAVRPAPATAPPRIAPRADRAPGAAGSTASQATRAGGPGRASR